MKTLVCKEHQSKHAYPRKWKLTSSWFGLPHVSMIAKKLGADMKNINFITQQLLIRKPITINSLQVEGESDAGTYKWYGGVNQSHFDVLSHLRCTILPRLIKTSSPKITLRFIFSKNFFSEGNFSGIRSCLTFTILHGSACSRCRNFVFFEREKFSTLMRTERSHLDFLSLTNYDDAPKSLLFLSGIWHAAKRIDK